MKLESVQEYNEQPEVEPRFGDKFANGVNWYAGSSLIHVATPDGEGLKLVESFAGCHREQSSGCKILTRRLVSYLNQ